MELLVNRTSLVLITSRIQRIEHSNDWLSWHSRSQRFRANSLELTLTQRAFLRCMLINTLNPCLVTSSSFNHMNFFYLRAACTTHLILDVITVTVTGVIQGDQKVSVHLMITIQKKKNTEKYFKQFQSLTIIT
jgi:hypothetical protein